MVGGAVRDMLLGLPVVDRDWVVVGSTPEELVALGFLPVGKDFPVFLHPKTKEEYALARTERKTTRGYRGFAVHAAPSVTLEEDLARRDLTINSIAACALIDWSTGRFGTEYDTNIGDLIDPFGGQRDIQAKLLRHVTEAFAEDPVRILRVARFAARFTDFGMAPETMSLMARMVASGETDALVAERVWQELSNGLMQAQPARMMQVLHDCGALQKLLPELVADEREFSVLNTAAKSDAMLSVRFACLMSKVGRSEPEQLASDPNCPNINFPNRLESITGICERLRVPVDCRELACVVAREQVHVSSSRALDARALVQLLQRCDAFRRPQRFADVLLACECISSAGQTDWLMHVLGAAQDVATDVIATKSINMGSSGQSDGEAIARAILDARCQKVAAVIAIDAPNKP